MFCVELHVEWCVCETVDPQHMPAISGEQPPAFPHRDWRFNEFPNAAAHALHATCVELMALPITGQVVGSALLDVVLCRWVADRVGCVSDFQVPLTGGSACSGPTDQISFSGYHFAQVSDKLWRPCALIMTHDCWFRADDLLELQVHFTGGCACAGPTDQLSSSGYYFAQVSYKLWRSGAVNSWLLVLGWWLARLSGAFHWWWLCLFWTCRSAQLFWASFCAGKW